MKRVACPKCDNKITFNETRYDNGGAISFVCPHCGKRFNKTLAEIVDDENDTEGAPYGYIVVLENAFGYKQEFPLRPGDNTIGRKCKGTEIECSIESGDMSMDRRHCIIRVKQDKKGKLTYTLRDFPSITGTFLRNEILGDKDRVRLNNGDVITIGATTFIIYFPETDEEVNEDLSIYL